MLLHASLTVRVFQTAVAKAGHAQTRRRDEATEQPNLNMKCAAVVLSYNQIENLKLPQVGPRFQQGSGILALQLALADLVYSHPMLMPLIGAALCHFLQCVHAESGPQFTHGNWCCLRLKHDVPLKFAG